MSQSSVDEQVKEIGLPVRRGTRMIARDPKDAEDLRRMGSDLWFSRWAHNVFKNYPLISKCYGARFLHEACHGMPAFVVGIGPSLDESIKGLKYAKGRAIIIATDAALRPLLANGITPDLVMNLDCQDIQKKLWENIPPEVRVPGLLNSCTHRDTIMSWPGPILFYNQYHTQDELCNRILPDVLPELGQIPSAGTVGTMAIEAAHLMGCDPICAVGMDFCYQPADADVVAWRYRAQDYAWTSIRPEEAPSWHKAEIKELYDNDERIARSFVVKGEDGKEFRSDPELTFYLESFRDIVPHFKIPLVNCSPDGMIPKLKTDLQGNPVGGYSAMSVRQAIDKYCKGVFQGGRSVLAHLDKIVPDPRPRDMVNR